MSSRINILEIPLDELKTLVLESLKINSQTQYVTICSDVAELAVKKKLVPNPLENQVRSRHGFLLDRIDEDRVREVIWDLIIERILTIGIDSANNQWPFLKLTGYGEKVVNSTKPIPHDPAGYIKRINNEIQNIDPIILTYLEECLNTYNINALLSSTITLGCASEKALLLLIESYTNAIKDSQKRKTFKNKTELKTIKRKFEEFSKSLSTIIGNLPREISDEINNVLNGVFEMIRKNRNDAGHPTGKLIHKEELFANIQVFIPYCKKIYQLIDYFSSNKV